MYKDVSNSNGYDIFINSSDYDLINDLLLNFNDIVNKYRDYVYAEYSVYIYKDEEVFNNTNFDLYLNNIIKDFDGWLNGQDVIKQYTGREVIMIEYSREFNRDLFVGNGYFDIENKSEDIENNTYEYFIFLYNTSFPEFQIYGVK